MFVAVSLMPASDRPASTGDVNASESPSISRCHSYDLRAKSLSVPALKHSSRASNMSSVVESPSLPFIPSKRRRLSSYSSAASQSGKFWTTCNIEELAHPEQQKSQKAISPFVIFAVFDVRVLQCCC